MKPILLFTLEEPFIISLTSLPYSYCRSCLTITIVLVTSQIQNPFIFPLVGYGPIITGKSWNIY